MSKPVSINKKNVIRGMHFQVPPSDHTKLVYVTSGRIIDVVLDIRKNSNTYGKFFFIELSADVPKCIYIPKGFAHGFISFEDDTCVHYMQTTCYDKECDCGIRYNSFGFDWNIENPVVSERDLVHPLFKDFISPFTGKKVLLTGSTGLIGKEAVRPLQEAGFQVYCLSTENCDLFDYHSVDCLLEEIKPEYLLHFAWITGGDYLINPINKKYVDASMNLLESFGQHGGKRAVMAGTCFEYGIKDRPLKETDPLFPASLYAQCKIDLFQKAGEYCKNNGISFGWGRIFCVYGHNEKPGRLTSILIRSLQSNEPVTVSYGNLVRDYMYSRDVADAFVKFLESDVIGAINICSGKGVSLRDFSTGIAEELGRTDLLKIEEKTTPQPPFILGDNSKLKSEVGYMETTEFHQAIRNILRD